MDYRIKDIHLHVGSSDRIPHSLPFDKITSYMKKYGIEEVAVFPFETNTKEDNLKLIQISKENRSIHTLYWIDKERIDFDVKQLQKGFDENALIGVKFHGVFENLPVSDPVYRPILEVLNDRNGVLLVHCGRFKDGNPESTSSYTHALNMAKIFPKIKIVLGHMGGNDTGIVKKAVNESIDLKNVFFETSGISTPIRVEYAVDKLGSHRILFGSDFPWCSFRGNFFNVEDSLLLTEKDKQMIFSDNFSNIIHG